MGQTTKDTEIDHHLIAIVIIIWCSLPIHSFAVHSASSDLSWTWGSLYWQWEQHRIHCAVNDYDVEFVSSTELHWKPPLFDINRNQTKCSSMRSARPLIGRVRMHTVQYKRVQYDSWQRYYILWLSNNARRYYWVNWIGNYEQRKPHKHT